MKKQRSALRKLSPETIRAFVPTWPPDHLCPQQLAEIGARIRQIETQIRHLRALKEALRDAWEAEWERWD